VFNNEHSLHLWKRHPCISTVWRQLTDWREQVTTWRDLRGLLYSHSDIVCLLMQSNCIELQQSINILIWVAWHFDHCVYSAIFSLIPTVRMWPGRTSQLPCSLFGFRTKLSILRAVYASHSDFVEAHLDIKILLFVDISPGHPQRVWFFQIYKHVAS
jgi:hypothetical protein